VSCRSLLASDALPLASQDWAAALGDDIIPMVAKLARAVSAQSATLRGADRTLRLAVGLMTKTLLQNLIRLRAQPSFPELWDRILQVWPDLALRLAPSMLALILATTSDSDQTVSTDQL
jgi:hypothetical protein